MLQILIADALASTTSPRSGPFTWIRCPHRRRRRRRNWDRSRLWGVAGGELLISTIVVLFAVDIGLGGSSSLAVLLPTTLVVFIR